MNTKMRVKSYDQVKREQEAMVKQKKKAITDVLTSAKNNPKFAKLLSYSFTSLDKMITPPNSDARLNAQLVIESGGIEVLRSIALKNPHNEEIMKQIANLILKLTSVNQNSVDQELSQKFVAAKGHEAVIEMLLSKDKDSASVPLIKCLNNLCQVPQLINNLLNSGLAEAIKLVNDMYSDDMAVVRMNLDTMKKVSNQKNGREFLIKKGIVPSILSTVKNCSDRMDNNAVYNGLIVIDNLCRSEEGKQEVKNADAPNILCDVVENFSESARILNKAAKILGKIMTKPDLEKLLGKIKNCSDKLDRGDDQETINEIKDNVALVSNLMLVDELGKTVCEPNNFNMLSSLFSKLSKIDLANKNPRYVKDYMKTKKHFLNLIKRECEIKPEMLDDDDLQSGDAFTILMETVDDCAQKNWNNTMKNVEELEQSGDKDGDLIPLKNAWKGLFTSYSDIVKLRNDRKNEEQRLKPKWVNLMNYLVGDMISKGKTYFGEDEKPNYSASNILKIANDMVNNDPDECKNLEDNIKKCFPYMKGVIQASDNWKTLKNNLDVIYNTVLNESDDSPIKKDIIPVVTEFMDVKFNYRNPNLVNLNILDDYLKPEFASQMLKRPDVKANPNFGLNYVKAIDSAMIKPFYTSSTLLKEVGAEDDFDKDEDNDQKEPKNEDVEKKIIGKGAELLKRLIPLEEYVQQIKVFKRNANNFNPDTSKVDDVLKLEDNLIYQNCALNVDDFFKAGMTENLGTLKDLIKKEMNFIESFKRLKSNENNPKYKDICDASNKRLKLELGTLRKLEDQGIDKFGKTKDNKYKNLLKDIIDVNADIINKSSDTQNLMEHLDQLRNNVAFLRDNEKELSDDKNKSPSETYINSLMKLLNKAINDEDLSDSIIKTLIAFANKKPNICNLLVKAGCPRMLLQILDKTQNRQLANDAMELFKMITLSGKENAEVIGNQNILLKLFEIRSKFASSDSITKNADATANELLKMPGQGKFAEGFIKDAIKEFHDNVQKDFKNNEVKQKILNNEEVINSFTSNPKAIEPILERQFIKDFNRACHLTTKDPEISITIDKLLTNEMGILKKIKDNIPSKDDDRHADVVDDILKILLDKSNYEEPLLLACKCLSDYVKDDRLFNKYLSNKIDVSFIDKLFAIQDDYLDNPEIIKEINNILCLVAVRNPKLAEAIIKKGGLANVIEELKSVANLNDPASKLLKLNGLKMLNSLLNNNKNLDAFLKAGGVDLINKIVKNEVDSTPKNEENEDTTPEDKYLTKGTIFTKTPEQLEEDEKLGINSYTFLGLNKEEADKKRAQLLNDDNKSRDSTSSGGESEDSDNYFVQCLKIINKGLDNGKKDFVDDKTVQNLTNLAAANFPDKFLFNEIATILANKDVKLNPDAIEDLKDLMKLTLSNKAQFYGDGNVAQKVKAINEKIGNMLMNDIRYKAGLKSAIQKKGFNDRPIPGKLSDDRFGDMPKRAPDDGRPIPGKLNDDRWDMGKRAPDDNRPLPGKLKNPFDGQGKPDDKNRPIPGKLKPFGEQKPEDDRNRNIRGRKPGGEEDNQEQIKLLTYLSLLTEPESFKNVFAETTPEICSFFNHLNSNYRPVIDKILKDKEDKIKELQNKNLSAKSERGDNPIIVEPFNINSLPDNEKYDEGVVLSLAKLYRYILEQAAKNGSAYRPGKLKNPFDGQGKPGDKNRPIPGKLKNPYDGQGKPGDKNRPIPGKLKKQGEKEPEGSGPRKYGKKGGRNEDDEIYKNLLSGNLSPEDPVNNEFVTNLQIMADPVYNPENYIFVKQFNNEMNKIMDNLGKYDEEPSPQEDKIEVTENYLAHLGALFSKAVPFLDDLHKEINNDPHGRYPDLKKEKEENLDEILNGTEQYYKCDEDNDIKAEGSKDMFDVCLNLIDDLSKDDIVEKGREDKLRNINKITNKLWNLVNHAIKSDENNYLVDPNNANRLRELINKLDTAINVKGVNDKKLREIPKNLSEKIPNGEDKVGQEILDFIFNDLAKHGNDPDVRYLDELTLCNLSKFQGLMKQIMKNDGIWKRLKQEYQDPNITYEKRLMLAKLFNNATKNNYNIENMIDNDPQGMKALLDKMINDPVKTLENGGADIAETEVETLCNLLKETNNYRAFTRNKLITENQIQKLDSLYKNLDPKIGEPLKPILAQIREEDKAKKEKDNVAGDEKKLLTIEKRVGNCFETHKKILLKYASLSPEIEKPIPGKLNDDRWEPGKRAPDDNRPLPGKLKNPFDGQGKPEDKNRPIPGKLKNPFDGQGKPEERERNIPGKLKNPFGPGAPEGSDRNTPGKLSPFGEQPEGNDFLKKASSLRKMSFVSGALLLHQADNAKIKSSLSSKENPEITNDINNIISMLRKNYNDMKNTKEPELNVQRAENVHKCLNLLKKLALAPDNHKPILEGGFMNFMEKLDDDYKLIKDNGEPDLNNKNLGFEVNSKNVLQACSNSDNAIPIIAESPVFESTIKEVNNLYNRPELIAANGDVEKLFSYDNVIFSNLCKDKEAFNNIFNKMGLDKLMKLGKKTGNANLLHAILNMLKNYIKNSPDLNRVPPEIIESTFEIMNKSAGLSDRNAPLMCEVLNLGDLLYKDNLKPRVENLQLIKIMNDDIDSFKGNHGYLNSCLNLLSKLTKDNPMNAKQALDSGLLKKLNLQVSNIVQEGPEKYEANKDNNEEDENGYLKTCYNLSKLYKNLVENDMENVDKFNQMGITEKTVNMLDHFNKKVEPKTEEEKAADLYRNKELSSSSYRKGEEENVDKMKPSQLVRGIMTNCGGALEQITVPPASNDYLSTRTTFNDTINKTLENENNDTDYLISALRALSNHVFNDNGKNYSKLDLPRDYKICRELQSKFYSNPEILSNINSLAGAMVRNLKDDNKGKEYAKKFYDLIPESIKVQDYNPDLVLMSLKLMNDSLNKKPYLIDHVYDETVPTVLNILKLYKDNPEIQENGYKILSAFARNNIFSSAMINNGLLDVMKDTLQNTLFSDEMKDNVIELKSEIFKLVNTLSQEKENCPKISDELMGNLISNVIEKGYTDEGKIIVPLLQSLVLNNNCIPPFVQYNGIDACIKLLNDNESNVPLISNIFSIFKNVSNSNDEYKKMLQDKKVPDLVNRIIKKMGPYDKKIEFEGRQLLFNVNLYKVQLEDPNSIGVDEIKIVEPIPPEVRNYLTSGKQIKIVNNNGDIKPMQLIFAPDLMRVSAKKLKSNLPPKPKYIIETPTIKKILKGHGTDNFKKSKGLFRKIPPPELCFSIIGPTSVEGMKSLNVLCETEKEVDKWIKYLEIVINYFKNTKAIKGAVIVKKK